jgi:hypothetical protein
MVDVHTSVVDEKLAPLNESMKFCILMDLQRINLLINTFSGYLKAKAVPLHTTGVLGGEKVQLLLILDLGTR